MDMDADSELAILDLLDKVSIPWAMFYDQGKPHSLLKACRPGDACTFKDPPSDDDFKFMHYASFFMPELMANRAELMESRATIAALKLRLAEAERVVEAARKSGCGAAGRWPGTCLVCDALQAYDALDEIDGRGEGGC